MKKLISLFLAVAAMLLLCSCADGDAQGKVENDPISQAQSEIIATLGITVENSRIVAYENANNYVKYIVAYYDNSLKTQEIVHYFYNNNEAFNKDKKNFEGVDGAEIDASRRYIRLASAEANTGSYSTDKALFEKKYNIK